MDDLGEVLNKEVASSIIVVTGQKTVLEIASYILVAVGADIRGDVGHSHPEEPGLAWDQVVQHAPEKG